MFDGPCKVSRSSRGSSRQRAKNLALSFFTARFHWHLARRVAAGADARALDGTHAPADDARLREKVAVAPTLIFDVKAGVATSRAAALAMLIGRRVSSTRNASTAVLRHRFEVKDNSKLGHAGQRERLSELGLPWDAVPPALGYGSLVLAQDATRELHVRLRLPKTRESALALERAVFEERRWPARGALAEEHPLYGETPLPVM